MVTYYFSYNGSWGYAKAIGMLEYNYIVLPVPLYMETALYADKVASLYMIWGMSRSRVKTWPNTEFAGYKLHTWREP